MKNDLRTKNELHGRILILKEKHATRYFDASSLEKLHAAALSILKERISPKYGYITNPGKLSDWYGCKEEYNPTDEEIAALPLALHGTAESKRRLYRQHRKEWEREMKLYETARQAVKEKDGAAAWEVLLDRGDYEYEGHRFEYLENV